MSASTVSHDTRLQTVSTSHVSPLSTMPLLHVCTMFPSSACRSYNNICPPTVVLLLHVYKILFYWKFILGFVVVSVSNQSIIWPHLCPLSQHCHIGAWVVQHTHDTIKNKGTQLTTDEAWYTECQEYVVSIRKELQPRSMGSSGSLQGNQEYIFNLFCLQVC